jgi:hypothetical protein
MLFRWAPGEAWRNKPARPRLWWSGFANIPTLRYERPRAVGTRQGARVPRDFVLPKKRETLSRAGCRFFGLYQLVSVRRVLIAKAARLVVREIPPA